MKILIVDTVYQDFLRSVPFNPASTYESELRFVLEQSFGTADYYSRNLRELGWEVQDVIANHYQLQELWANENPGRYCGERWKSQLAVYNPDILFLQDLSLRLPFKKGPRPKGMEHPLVAGQCSCPWPGDEAIQQCDVIFTSFPHYVERIEALGVKAVYNPLAFDPIVLERIGPISGERIHDAVFVGGVGAPSHWKAGMQILETVAREIPTFKWWGYGHETLPSDSPLRDKYQGTAFGLDMYRIFLQSKIVLNRHGEVAQGITNNMRCFEATGCGAALLTEATPNLSDFFKPFVECIPYESAQDAVEKIKLYLLRWKDCGSWIAMNGQKRTLRDHTYAQRMKTISDTLKEILCPVP